MAYFARINILTSKVDKVIVSEQEIIDTYPDSDRWVETSNEIRGNFAGIGFIYDVDKDLFYPPAPASSWTFNEETAGWESPVPCPTDGEVYIWNEETQSWDAVE